MSTTSTITEIDIMADVIGPDAGDLSLEVARSVLRWKFTDRAVSRMTELADRNSADLSHHVCIRTHRGTQAQILGRWQH